MLKGPAMAPRDAATFMAAWATVVPSLSASGSSCRRKGPMGSRIRTWSPLPGDDLAGDRIRQRDGREAEPVQNLGADQSVDVMRSWGHRAAGKRDQACADQDGLPGLKRIGDRGDNGRHNRLYQRQRGAHPRLFPGVVEAGSNVRQLRAATARVSQPLNDKARARLEKGTLTTAGGP